MRHIRLAWAALGVLLLVIGLPSIGSDIAGWAAWLRWLDKTASHYALIGVGLFSISCGLLSRPLYEGAKSWWQSRRVNEAVTPIVPATGAAPVAGASAPTSAPEQPAVETAPTRITATPTAPLAQAVSAEQTLRRRIELLVRARRLLLGEFRAAFEDYVRSFLESRREIAAFGADIDRMHEVRQEYRLRHRLVAQTYRRIREHYRRFVDAEADYDLRGEMFDPPEPGLPLDYPLTHWWRALTFDEAVNNLANADDEHLGALLDRQRAVLDAFGDWLAHPESNPLAKDAEGVQREEEKLLLLVRHQQQKRDQRERRELPRAKVLARSGMISGGQHFDTYYFEAINCGPVAASGMRAWAANDQAERVSPVAELQVLPPDNKWYPFTLHIRPTISRAGELDLVIAWRDDAGEHERVLLEIEPLR